MEADIRSLLPILHVAARRAAVAKGHQSPADHVNRAHRFVEFLIGHRFDRPGQAFPCPEAWRPLLAYWRPGVAANPIGFLARCCILAGEAQAPAVLPADELLERAAVELLGSERAIPRLDQAKSIYRTARKRHLADDPTAGTRFAPLPIKHNPRCSHVGASPEARALVAPTLAEMEDVTTDQMLRALAPGLADDLEAFTVAPEQTVRFSDSHLRQCRETMHRVAGWATRAGIGPQLGGLKGLDELFTTAVASEARPVANPRLDRFGSAGAPTISLLEHLAVHATRASLERSPVAGRAAKEGEHPFFTDAIIDDCHRIWGMTSALYGDLVTRGDTAAMHWALVTARWKRLEAELAKWAIPDDQRVNTKDKRLMIRTCTLPQLVCVALPLRRLEIRARREVWVEARRQAAAAGHLDGDANPAVRRAAREYFRVAVPHLMLTIALDDGLREQQYRFGRLGEGAHFRVALRHDELGRPAGLASMTTWWSGQRVDPAHLKVRTRKGRLNVRENRDLRPGYTDLEVLWDVVSVWRPARLRACGAVPSDLPYDLAADLQAGAFALFPTAAARVERPEASMSGLTKTIGRELHYLVRSFLRPELPEWKRLPEQWRGLFTTHILRLLTSSYWGGVRGDWETATYLTNDTKRTLEQEYTELATEVKERLGLNRGHWEHPNAYDCWMDRLYVGKETLNPLLDPTLPLPDHVQPRVEAVRAGLKPMLMRPRFRRARPGQQGPAPRPRQRADAA